MTFRNSGGERCTGGSRWGAALVAAVVMAGLGAGASRDVMARQSERTALSQRALAPDQKTVSPEARKSYDTFWKKLPREKADVLERELSALEARARRGESVDRELEPLRREYPGFFQLSQALESARWVAGGGGTSAGATCTGLSWIGRNGRVRCIGRLTT